MALTKITNSLVAINAIQGTLIADNAVTTVHIVNNAITATQLADNAVTATKIQNGIIATDHLAADLITAAKIADDAISEEHLDVTVISSLTAVTANSSDYVLIGDASDSNNLKKALVSDLGNSLANDVNNRVVTGTGSGLNAEANLTFDGSTLAVTGAATISTTLAVTGVISPTTHIDMPDNAKILLGTGDDLEIYHDGSNSYISETGTGNLYIKSNADNYVNLISAASDANLGLVFRSSDATQRGYLLFDSDDYIMTFGNSAERMRIGSGGKVSWSAGGIGAVATQSRDFTFYTEGASNGVDIRSNDYQIAFIGAGASSGSGMDAGYAQICVDGAAKIVLNANGDSSFTGGNVGIGTTSPMTLLHVFEGDGSYPDDANNHLVVESDSHSYIGIGGGTSSDVGIHFGDSGGIQRGRIAYLNGSDAMAFNANGSERMRITSTGELLVGITSSVGMSGAGLETAGSIKARNYIQSTDLVGSGFRNVNTTASGSLTVATSLRELKENITAGTIGLAEVMQLKPIEFDWKDEEEWGTGDIGFIADEVFAVNPKLCTYKSSTEKTEENLQGVKYAELTTVLVKAVQELEARLAALEE
jgi:hypothetical protein